MRKNTTFIKEQELKFLRPYQLNVFMRFKRQLKAGMIGICLKWH
jgi:hypothetical protein